MSSILLPAKIQLKDIDASSNAMKAIEGQFYQFIMHKMLTSEFSKEDTLYYSRFLKNEFTKFKVGRGYPLIYKDCQSAQCYFYIRFEKEQDFLHPFLQLLTKRTPYSCQFCKIKFSVDVDKFVYDAGLAGFLQHKLKGDELKQISEVEITKNNDIHLLTKGKIYEAMNFIRLTKISHLAPELTQDGYKQETIDLNIVPSLNKTQSNASDSLESSGQEKKEDKKQDKSPQIKLFQAKREKGRTMKAKTEEILNNIRNQMLSSSTFVGSKFSLPKAYLNPPNPKNIVMPVVYIQKKNGNVILYQQENESHSFLAPISISKINEASQTQAEKISEGKYVHYYDSQSLTIYFLSASKQVYFCDLRYMYNMIKGCFNLQFLCRLTQLEEIKPETTRIIVTQNKLYIFVGKNRTFINVYKANLPQKLEDNMDVPAQMILQNKFRYRLGFNLCFVPTKHLMNDECIIVFGGVIQKMPTIKLLEVMLLPKNAPQKYFYHKISLANHDNECLNQRNPTFAIYKQNLVVWGGTLPSSNNQTIYSRNLAIVPLKDQPVIVAFQELLDDHQKDNLVDATSFGSVHVGNRISKEDTDWLVMMKGLHKSGRVNAVRIREQKGVFTVQSFRNSKDS